MPRVKQRSNAVDGWQAAASAIQGFSGGYRQGRQNQRAQERHDAQLARYAEADRRAQKQEREKAAAREFLIGQAELKRKEQADALDREGLTGFTSPEEINARRAKIQEGFERIKTMAPFLTANQTLTLLDEYSAGQKSKIIAEEYKKIDDEITALERNEIYPMDSGMAKAMRESLKEGAPPKEVIRQITSFKRLAGDTISQQRKVERGMARGQQYLDGLQGDSNIKESNYQMAESLMYQWAMTPKQSISELIGAMQAASYGVRQKGGWSYPKREVVGVPVPTPAPAPSERGWSELSTEERVEKLKALKDAAGG